QLVKGIAQGLGITGPVHSPSFALVNVYSDGRMPLFHLDLYRLDTIEQILAAGLEEYLQPEGVTVIEWAERWFGEPAMSEFQASRDEGGSPKSKAQTSPDTEMRNRALPGSFRWVRIETVSDMERRIIYEPPGP